MRKTDYQMAELPQILLCRQLHMEAERFLQQDDGCALGLAVSITQDAIELFVRAATKHIGMDLPKDKAGFSDVVNELARELAARNSGPLPYRTKLEEINKARINFKHYGLSPTKGDASRLLDYGEAFLVDASRNIFGFEFLSLSYADLISNSAIRSLVKQSAVCLQDGSIEESLCHSAHVVRLAMVEMENALPSIRALRLGWDLPSSFREIPDVRRTAEGLGRTLNDAFDSLKEVAILSGLSIDLLRYGRFKELTPVVHLISGGPAKFQATQFTKKPGGTEDVYFCIAFATDFALAVQKRLPIQALASE